jgi:hypothetical protein
MNESNLTTKSRHTNAGEKSKIFIFYITLPPLASSVDQKFSPQNEIVYVPVKTVSDHTDCIYKLLTLLVESGAHMRTIVKLVWLGSFA